MKSKLFLAAMIAGIFFSCRKSHHPIPVPPPPASQQVLLKDIIHASLPSPYYHFEYDNSGKYIKASYQSGIRLYDVVHTGNKISEIKNNTITNKDRLQYEYDNDGRVILIKFIDKDGIVFKRCFLTYDGNKLAKMEWDRKLSTAGYVVVRFLTFAYQADGNLLELTSHRPAYEGQTEVKYTERYEQYDNKKNTDGFSLIHENMEHLILLPGVQLQKNNPQKVIRTSIINAIGYTINYTYTYNQQNVPLTKTGGVLFTNGQNAGQRLTTNTMFSYY